MKYTHDSEGLMFEKLQVSSSQTHYQCADSEDLKEKVRQALDTGDYSEVQFILVRTAELMQLPDGEVYGRYCPLEIVMERSPYYAGDAKAQIMLWLSEGSQELISQQGNTNPKPHFLRRVAARLEALADRLENH